VPAGITAGPVQPPSRPGHADPTRTPASPYRPAAQG
jgi:hypothetical protein